MKKWMLTYSAASEKGSRDTNQDNLRVGAAHSYFDMESPVWVEGCMEAQSPEVFCVYYTMVEAEGFADYCAVPRPV